MERAFLKISKKRYFNVFHYQTNVKLNGLSLTYDIKKVQGGEIKVKERKETESPNRISNSTCIEQILKKIKQHHGIFVNDD